MNNGALELLAGEALAASGGVNHGQNGQEHFSGSDSGDEDAVLQEDGSQEPPDNDRSRFDTPDFKIAAFDNFTLKNSCKKTLNAMCMGSTVPGLIGCFMDQRLDTLPPAEKKKIEADNCIMKQEVLRRAHFLDAMNTIPEQKNMFLRYKIQGPKTRQLEKGEACCMALRSSPFD